MTFQDTQVNDARTLPELLDRAAEARPDVVALSYPEGRVTYRELADRTMALACRLLGAGVERGDRVGLLLPGSIDGFALVLATLRVGAIAVPVNARYKARELEYVVRHAGMRLLVAEASSLPLLEEAGILDLCRVVIGIDDPGFVDGGASHASGDVARIDRTVDSDDDALMLYTSGTTANPKGAVHRHLALVWEGGAIAERLRLGPDDVFWTPLPFFHCGGIAVLAGAFAAQCTCCEIAQFDAGVALDQLEHDRVTVAFPAFETIWLAVLNHPRFDSADLSALRLVVNVGVPSTLRRMQERVHWAPQISCYGSTETFAFACQGVADDSLEQRTTTSGKTLRGIEIRAVDPDTGAPLGPGEVGELVMRGPTRFVRYHDDPAATANAIDAEGWFHSGDLGRVDEEGRVSFVSRLKDMLKVGGENVAAAEVEGYLVEHPSVLIAQVVGVPDARYVEVPAAFIQLVPGAEATEQELVDFCRGKIATFKVPRYVRFVEDWPMSGTKIQKFRLRQLLIDELERLGVTEAPKIMSR